MKIIRNLLSCGLSISLCTNSNQFELNETRDQIHIYDKQTETDENLENKTVVILLHHAQRFITQKKYDDALLLCNEVLELEPYCLQAHHLIGVLFKEQNKKTAAVEKFNYVLSRDLHHSQAHFHLGQLMQQQGNLDGAINHFNEALLQDPHSYDIQINRARLLSEKHSFDQALQQYTDLIQSHPHDTTAWFEYANTLNMASKTEQALETYYQLLDKHPGNPSITYNIAYTLKKLGKIEEAMPYYFATLEKKPDHSEAHFSLGLAYLMMGDFEKGWEKYEWRWKRSIQYTTPRNYQQPVWDGSDLQGKTIFLYAEQGLGDTFQFIRYALLAKEKGGKVIVAVQRPLVQFLSFCTYLDKVISLHDTPPSFDVYAPLMSLPHILKTRIDTVPTPIPYLYAEQHLIELWKQKIATDKNIKIGICWQGNSNYSTAFLRAVVAAKSVPLNLFAPLSTIPGISLYSLQQETGIDQIKQLSTTFSLVTFDETFDREHGRFMDTAALIKNLDLVITIDTSISHLAAGLGIPTWVLIPTPPDWRWMLDRKDTPWYANMRLFRQPTPGDWQAVIDTIMDELKKSIANQSFTKIMEDTAVRVPQAKIESEQSKTTRCKLNINLMKSVSAQLDDLFQFIRTQKFTHALDEQFIHAIRVCYQLLQLKDELYHRPNNE